MRILRRVPSRRRALLVAGATALVGASVAVASTLTAGAVVRVPDNPLGGSPTCAALVARQTAAGSVNYPDSEVEPYVAVNPANPMHLIGTFQQDRWNDGGANGLTNVVSTNGGASWSLAAGQPAFTICEGAVSGSPGYLDRATDPWVAFSADGQVAVFDQRLVQRQRSGLRRHERDHDQPIDRRRQPLANARRRPGRHLDDGAQRQGVGDGRPARREYGVCGLGSARLSE